MKKKEENLVQKTPGRLKKQGLKTQLECRKTALNNVKTVYLMTQ